MIRADDKMRLLEYSSGHYVGRHGQQPTGRRPHVLRRPESLNSGTQTVQGLITEARINASRAFTRIQVRDVYHILARIFCSFRSLASTPFPPRIELVDIYPDETRHVRRCSIYRECGDEACLPSSVREELSETSDPRASIRRVSGHK